MNSRQAELNQLVKDLHACQKCPRMHRPAVSGAAVLSKVLLVGQAPGTKEPIVGKPFAWTAGKTMFKWFLEQASLDEENFRKRVYMAAVCRCFPGKKDGGGDRVPHGEEIAACAQWMRAEFALLKPQLVIAVGKLAIEQFMTVPKLNEVIGKSYRAQRWGHCFDLVPLPHPSGASPWHRTEPGRTLLARALGLIAHHRAWPKVKVARQGKLL